MKITWKASPTDPLWPIMHGSSPLAKEFNRRQKKLFEEKKFDSFSFEQVTIVLLEILGEDYDKRRATKRKKPIKGVDLETESKTE